MTQTDSPLIHTIDLRGRRLGRRELVRAIPRAVVDVAAATDAARALVDDVRDRGADALLDQSERFDGVRPAALRVPAEQIARAAERLDSEVRAALETAIGRVREASAAQVPPAAVTRFGDGAEVRQRWQPVGRVGLYVPGGKAVYPSSVVMNVVPAQVAGVASIAIASPAQRDHDGSVHPTVLGAAGLLGIDEVYAIGGAGAIGAFAWGVPELGLEPVDLVTGPGNVFVAAAKRIVRGMIGIDAEAGPTEILIIADATADPFLIAADLVSQSEHDELAAAVLVTDAEELARSVQRELAAVAASAHHGDRVRAALSGQQSAIVLVDDIPAAAALSNAYAPEHLELHVDDNEALLAMIENAGAIFVGPHSPVSLGDYLAGSNHVLPTGGQARFSPGLGAYTFLRAQQVVHYSESALEGVAPALGALAHAEDLPAHAGAVSARFLS